MLARKDIIYVKNNKFPEGLMLDCSNNKLDKQFIVSHSKNTASEVDEFVRKDNTLCFSLIYRGNVIMFAGVEMRGDLDADLKIAARDKSKMDDDSVIDFLGMFVKEIMKPGLSWTFSCDQMQKPDLSMHRLFMSEQSFQDAVLKGVDKYNNDMHCLPKAKL